MSAAERARELLKTAAGAEQALRESVRELVAMRAWTVLGYKDFSAMWLQENGFRCPTHVQALGLEAMNAEGGHTNVEMALALGLGVYDSRTPGTAKKQSPIVWSMLAQLAHGVPAERVRKATSKELHLVINEHGDRPYEPRKRAQPRRLGKGPDELVDEGFKLPRREADEIADIARQANVPKAEIYRQAVAEYLDRLREAKKAAS